MAGVRTFVLSELEAAIRSSWSAETATPPNRELWSATNPAWDQCGVTALVVSDLLGGDLVCGEVHQDGVRIDYHWWNLLGSGLEVDLTREQFINGEQVAGKDVVPRPPNEKIVWLREEYELLSDRVRSKLGL